MGLRHRLAARITRKATRATRRLILLWVWIALVPLVVLQALWPEPDDTRPDPE